MSALLKLLLIKPFRGRSRFVGSPDVRMGINMRWLSGSFVSVLRRIARVILDIQSVSSSPVPGGCHIRYGSRLEISEGVRDSLFLVLVRYSYDSCVDTAGWQFHFGSINGVSHPAVSSRYKPDVSMSPITQASIAFSRGLRKDLSLVSCGENSSSWCSALFGGRCR